MLTLSFLSTALGLLALGTRHADALSIPITKRAPPHSTSVRISSSNNVSGDDPFGFQSVNGFAYTGVIYVSGQPFTVQLDTGSSDLWLDTQNVQLTNLTDTGVVGSILYVDGTGAVGNINLGAVKWGEFTVSQQAFINAPGSNATSGGAFNGLLGVGPPSLSNVDQTLKSANSQYDGSSFLDNVFALYPNEPNFMTFLLSRNEFGISDGGVFTIGDVDSNYTNVTSAPKLPIVAPNLWGAFMDGVIVNGEFLYGGSLGSSLVPHIPVNQTLVILDTGTSLSTAPPAYVDAMYSKIPGAQFDGQGGYIVPCDARINVTMVFGENQYPMHPIDLTLPGTIDDAGNVLCQGAFSYSPSNSGVDFILGDSFLRNVYTLYDFGSWAKVGDTPPFMQILSVTDLNQACAEFASLNQARIQQVLALYGSSSSSSASASPSAATNAVVATPTLATAAAKGTASAYSSPPSNNGKPQDLSVAGHLADSNDDDVSEDIDHLKTFSYVILGVLAFIAILLIVLIAMVANVMKKGKPTKGYKAIHDPTSAPYSEYKPYSDGGH